MCGIFGVIDNYKKINKNIFLDSLKLLNHRGPDNLNHFYIDDYRAFGHTRLSIIDLNKNNNQPFKSMDNKFLMVYNGEIYNYKEIKKKLISRGYSFRTKGDTEVLLNSYIEWGEECVNLFNGMWAFAIYDHESKKIFCSRDRFGIKPFNYFFNESQFIFSSEIKSILNYNKNLKKPNYKSIYNFCVKSIGAQSRNTWFKKIYRLLPGHNLIIKGGKLKIKKYWSYPTEEIDISQEDANKKYLELLEDSIKLRMRSDVEVGTTLSSGLDSTSIISLLRKFYNKKHKTYTAKFINNNFSKSDTSYFSKNIIVDEVSLIKKFQKEYNLDSKFIEIDYKNYIECLKKIIYHLESGNSSPPIFPLYKVINEAKKDVKVVLEGQGADELMGGYIHHNFFHFIFDKIKNLRFKNIINEINLFKKNYSLKNSFLLYLRSLNIDLINKISLIYYGYNGLFIGKLKGHNLEKDYPLISPKFSSYYNKELFKEHSGTLVNLLHYGDAISMSHSIESRLPFMDYRLVEFIFKLPAKFKINNSLGKYIHRNSMRKNLPSYIIDNPLKFGFTSPLNFIFSDEKSECVEILRSDKFLNRKLFDKKIINKILEQNKKKVRNHSRLLFRILCVELWFRTYIDRNNKI